MSTSYILGLSAMSLIVVGIGLFLVKKVYQAYRASKEPETVVLGEYPRVPEVKHER